jgi:Fe-S cluster biosynthesis and repair protein YggX
MFCRHTEASTKHTAELYSKAQMLLEEMNINMSQDSANKTHKAKQQQKMENFLPLYGPLEAEGVLCRQNFHMSYDKRKLFVDAGSSFSEI